MILRGELKRLRDTEILACFNMTKIRQRKQADQFVIVKDTTEMIQWFWNGIGNGNPNSAIWDKIDTNAIDKIMAKWKVDDTDMMNYIAEFQDPTNRHETYTAHSIKRGCVSDLMRLAARDIISPEQVSQMAKHKNAATARLAKQTVTYSSPTLVARVQKTHHITSKL